MGRSLFVTSRVFCFLTWFMYLAFAQNFAPSPHWQNTQFNISRSQIQSIAYEAAQNLRDLIDPSGHLQASPEAALSPTLKAGIAIVLSSQDLLNGSMAWKSPVTNFLSTYDTELVWNIDLSYFGLAELNAYLAYNDSTHLANAESNWEQAHAHFVTPAAAQTNSFPHPLNTTPGCGPTLGGMIFDHPNISRLDVHTYTISAWIALSSRLADITQNMSYLDVAQQSIQFVQNHLLDPGNVAAPINDGWDVGNCQGIPDKPVTYDLGPFIEGLSIVANMTTNMTGDQSYTHMLLDLIPKAVIDPGWTSDEGVIKEEVNDYRKGTMIRGLLEAKRRNPSIPDLAILIDDYVTVQYNAVRDHALISDNNYGVSWTSRSTLPSDPQSLYAGNVEALDVLNHAFAIAPTSTNQHSSVGAIAGGVAGGVVGVIAICLALFFCLRRRKRAREVPIREDKTEFSTPATGVAGLAPEPFVMPPSGHHRPALSKDASSYSQAGNLNTLNASSDRVGATSSSGATTNIDRLQGIDNAQAVGSESSVLSGLASRLDNLIDVLAVRGSVNDTPPDYDVRH